MTISRFSAVVLTVLFAAGGARAATATAHFTGTVTSTNANAVTISEIEVGDEVTGQFRFDTTSPDGMPADTHAGLYSADLLELSIRSYDFSASDNNISVSNDQVVIAQQPAVDAYEIVSPLRDVSGPSLSGLAPAQIDIVLVDTDAAVFSDDSLPLAIDLDAFEIVSEVPYGTTGGRLIFQSTPTGDIGEVRFEITGLTIELGSDSDDDVIVYPQLAVGGGYQVVLIVNNTTGSSWQGTIEPLLDDGSLDNLVTSIDLGPRESRRYTLTGGETTIVTGLTIRGDAGSSTSALAVAYFFNYIQDGVLRDSTGVAEGEASTRFTFPVEGSATIDTGLAVRRLPSQSDSPLALTLYNSDGTVFQHVSAGSDFARFFTELFDDVPSDFTGSLVVESPDDFYLVVLRIEFADGGFQLTSVPARLN